MPNIFVTIVVPSPGPATSAPVDTSDMAGRKTLVIEGTGDGLVTIEGSHNGSNFFPIVIFDIFTDPFPRTVTAVLRTLRARRLTGAGAVTITISAPGGFPNTFGTFLVPPGSTTGPTLSLGSNGELRTVAVIGNYSGVIGIEAAGNGGIVFDPVVTFNTQRTDVQNFVGGYQAARIRRYQTQDDGEPLVTIGVEGDAGGGEVPLLEELTNLAGSDLVQGEVVRISANDSISRSRADSAPNAQGTIGVVSSVIIPNGLRGLVTLKGKARALLEPGLVGVAAGQTLWVSPTIFGRATNIKPAGAGEVELCIGILKDATGYVIDQSVLADIDAECEPKVAGLVASIQCGKESFVNQATKTIVFAVPFVSPPTVVLTPIDQNDVTVAANLDAAPTALGFTIRMSAAYTGTVHWIACTD